MDDLQIPDEIPEESGIKKGIVLAIGIFLVFLMISYSFLNYGIADYVAGMFASSQVANDRIFFENGVVVFQGNTYKHLMDQFLSSDGTEFKACLQGIKKGSEYFVEKVFFPIVLEQTYRSVLAESCPT